MAKKVTATEASNSLGQQVFVFELPNGRTLKLEFCPTLIEPSGDPCCAIATLFEKDGEGISLQMRDGESDESMDRVTMWFSTREEDKRHSQLLTQELDAIKEQLAPVMEAIKKQDSYKHN